MWTCEHRESRREGEGEGESGKRTERCPGDGVMVPVLSPHAVSGPTVNIAISVDYRNDRPLDFVHHLGHLGVLDRFFFRSAGLELVQQQSQKNRKTGMTLP